MRDKNREALELCIDVIERFSYRWSGAGTHPQAAVDAARAALAQHPAPAIVSGVVELRFEYLNPANNERHIVYITPDDVTTNMDHVLFDKLTADICQCEPVGETNVVDCNCDEYAENFELCNTSIAQLPAPVTVPEWWKLVPVEPTPEMLSAAFAGKIMPQSMQHQARARERMAANYRAMLAASPAAPAPEAQEPVAWQARFTDPGQQWDDCTKEHHDFVKANPGEWSGYEVRELFAAPPAAEQPYSTTSDRYRAELYDEVWEKSTSMGYMNITMALAELERMKASEQPSTVKVPRELLESLWDVSVKARTYWDACERPGADVDGAADELEAAMGKAEHQCGIFNATGGIARAMRAGSDA